MIHNNDINENINNIINLIKNNKIIQIGLLLIIIIVIILFLPNVQYIEEKLLQIEIQLNKINTYFINKLNAFFEKLIEIIISIIVNILRLIILFFIIKYYLGK